MKAIAIRLLKKEKYISVGEVTQAVIKLVGNRFQTNDQMLESMIKCLCDEGFCEQSDNQMLKYTDS